MSAFGQFSAASLCAVVLGAVVTAGGCGGRIDQSALLDGGALADGSIVGDDGGGIGDGAADAPCDGDCRVAPMPNCVGEESACAEDDAGVWQSAAILKCDPVSYVGPWHLTFERQDVHGQFQVVAHVDVDEPGFGYTFTDTSVPRAHLTYRVCVTDFQGTRCGAPIAVSPPPNCKCEPITCDEFRTCNETIPDRCGGPLHCGACSDGTACNPANHSCCPPNFEPDGDYGCACAPPSRCPPGLEWDIVYCICTTINTPQSAP